MKEKTLAEFEREHGIMFIDARKYDPKQKMTAEDFQKLAADNEADWLGMMHETRIEFLKDNGYEVTRENMLNVDLIVRQKEES